VPWLQAKRRYSIAKRVDPGGGALVPERAANEQPARAGADYNGADSPPRCSLWPPLRTGSHNTASTSGRPPPPCGVPLVLVSTRPRLTTTYEPQMNDMLSGGPAPSGRSALEQMGETNHPVEASDGDDEAVTVTRSAIV
jgi:hypothetical protein